MTKVYGRHPSYGFHTEDEYQDLQTMCPVKHKKEIKALRKRVVERERYHTQKKGLRK